MDTHPLVFYNRPGRRFSHFHKSALISPLTINPLNPELLSFLQEHGNPSLNLYNIILAIITYCQSNHSVKPHPLNKNIYFTDTTLFNIFGYKTIPISQTFRLILPHIKINLLQDDEPTLDHKLREISGRPIITQLLPLNHMTTKLLPAPLNDPWNNIYTPDKEYYHPCTIRNLVQETATYLKYTLPTPDTDIFHSTDDHLLALFNKQTIHLAEIVDCIVTLLIEHQMLSQDNPDFKLQKNPFTLFFLTDLLDPHSTAPKRMTHPLNSSDDESLPALKTETNSPEPSDTEYEYKN